MEQHLGLTCDPVLGYVQIPCIERNVAAASCAIMYEKMASISHDKRTFSFDEIIKVMLQTGKDLKDDYRETSKSGLAKAYFDKKAGKLD
jgi:L-serine dehydratase